MQPNYRQSILFNTRNYFLNKIKNKKNRSHPLDDCGFMILLTC
jgi:hypothetical protein